MSIVSRSTQQHSTFDPRSIPGCQLWLDAADAGSVVLSGSNVTQWNDKSGNGRNVTQSTTASMPVYNTNGLNGLATLNLTSKFMNVPTFSFTEITVFAIYRYNAFSGFADPIMLGNFSFFYVDGSGRIGIGRAGATDEVLANASTYLTTSSFGILVGTVSVSTNTVTNLFINGITAASATVTSSGGQVNYTVGRSAVVPTNGTMAEAIVFDRVLTTSQRQQIEGYLAWKWNLQSYYTPQFALPTTAVSGCSLWLDAADSSTFSFSSGSNVSQWRDKSGNGRHANQTTTSSQPTLSGTLINFNGAQFLNMTDAYNMLSSSGRFYTLFVVERRGSANNNLQQYMIGGGGSTENQAFVFGYNNNTTLRHTNAIAPNLDYTVLGWANPDPIRMWGGGYNGTIRDTWLNGSLAVSQSLSTALAGWTQPVIGYLPIYNLNQFYTGNIYEILFFNSYLSTAQRQQIEGYLAWKWGLTNSFPAGHPWRLRNLPVSHPSFTIPPTLRSFQPTDIDGCQLWLDAADATSVVLSGSNVSQWRDKSGNGNNTTAVSGVISYNTTGLNSKPTLSFSNAYLTGAFGTTINSQTLFAFIVATIGSSTVGFSRLLSLGRPGVNDFNSTSTCIPFVRNINLPELYAVTNDIVTAKYTITYNSPFLSSSYISGSDMAINLNGSLTQLSAAVTTAFNITSYGIGTNTNTGDIESTFVGNISEIILYRVSSFSVAQRQQIEGYLAAKWGLSTALPPAIQAVPSVFDPRTITGCSLWLDAADSSTVTGTTNITALRDKSSNAYVFSNATGFSYNSVLFQGRFPSFYRATSASSVNLGSNTSITLTQPMTFFTVCSSPDSSTGTLLFDSLNSGNRMAFVGYNTSRPVMFAGTELFHSNTSAFTVPSIYSGTFNGASSTMFQNGTLVATGNTGTQGATGLIVGARFNNAQSWNGHICEILMYSGSLSTAQRQQIEGYLYAKWNVPVTRHPYYRMLALPATPLFVPSQLSGLQLWLDAADATSVVLSGSNVTQWNDKSGNGRNATATGTPTLSNGSVFFNGSSYFRGPISITGSTITTFAVCVVSQLPSVLTRNQRIISYATPSNNDWDAATRTTGINAQYATGTATDNTFSIYRNSAFVSYTPVISANTTYLVSSHYDGTQGSMYLNGIRYNPSNSSGNFAITSYGIGNQANPTTENLLGFISEIITYSGSLTTSQRQAVEGYLAHKWGLQNSTPATHPYRKFRA